MQWNRQYKIKFPEINREYANTLKIAFEVNKDSTKETNKSTLTIWNLSDESRNQIEVADRKVEIWAGYQDNSGPVRMFIGSVIEVETSDDGKDVTTKLTLSDGQVAIRDSVVSVSFAPGVGGETVVKYIADGMGLPVEYGEDVQLASYENGYSFVGKGGDALTAICNANGCEWSVQNEIIQIVLKGRAKAKRGLVFAADSGLIGSPERLIKAPKKEAKKTTKRKKKVAKGKVESQAGWKIKTLLAPTLLPGDAVKVESRRITGWFKVESVKHSGDTHEGDWISEIKLIERLIYE